MKERLEYIDFLKGLGIILVVAGHAGSPFIDWIYSFHMGLFFWISGYTMAIKPLPRFTVFLKKKIKTILIPYVVFGFIGILLQIRERAYYNSSISFYEYILGLVKGGNGLDIVGNLPLWFLQVLFIAILIFYVEIRFLPDIVIVAIGLIASVGTLSYQEIFNSGALFEMNVLPCALVYLTIGYYTYKIFSDKNVKISFGIILLSIGWYLQLCYGGGNQIRHIGTNWYYVYSIIEILGLFFICKKVNNLSCVKKCGEKSIYILGLHGLLVAYATLFINYIFDYINFRSDIVKHLGITLIILVWSYALAEVWISIKTSISEQINKIKINTKTNL